MTGGRIYNDTYGNTDPGRTDINIAGDVSIARSAITGDAMDGSKSGASIAITGTNITVSDASSINTDSFTSANGATISLNAAHRLQIDGTGTHVSTDADGSGKAGALSIEAPTIVIGTGATVSSSAAVIGGGPAYGAGAITVNAEQSLTLAGSIRSDTVSGTSGSITIRTRDLNITDTGLIGTSLLSNTGTAPRASGDIAITTTNVTMSGDGRIESRAFNSNSGSSGTISINAANVSLVERSAISASIESASGTGGHINITASGDILVSSNPINLLKEQGSISSDSTAGDAGHIRLEATDITVNNGAKLSTVAQGGTGKGGDITLIAHGTLNVEGSGAGGPSSIQTDTLAGGNAGRIELRAPQILVSDGGLVSSAALAGSTGNGGNISVWAGDILKVAGSGPGGPSINPSSIRTDTLASGTAGTIELVAPRILVGDGGLVSSASLPGSTGAAGDITMKASDRLTVSAASITTQSAQSQGGNIRIDAPGTISITRGDVTASAAGGYGNGGNVTINAGYLALNDSSITAQAEWGNGGNLLITVDKMFVKSIDSLLSASSRYGQQGTVVVNAPNTDVAGALASPVFDILNLNAFIPKRCMAPDELNASTFRLLGSDGLPAAPENSFPIRMSK
jgi:hypothetical protein